MTESMYFGIGGIAGLVIALIFMLPQMYYVVLSSYNMVKDIEPEYGKAPWYKLQDTFDWLKPFCLDNDLSTTMVSVIVFGIVCILAWPLVFIAAAVYGSLLMLRMKFRLQAHMNNKSIHKGSNNG